MKNKKLKFYEKSHTYKIGKKKLISVTSLISKFFPPFNAKEIARKLAKFQINKARKHGVRYWLNEWKEAAEHGTRVHEWLEFHILNTEPEDSWSLLEERDKKKIEQGKEWLYEFGRTLNNPIFKPEVQVYSEDYGLAGTIDLMIFVDSDENNGDKEVILVDWKTNKKIDKRAYANKKGTHKITEELDACNYIKYALQLNTYKLIVEKELGYKVKDMILLHLKEDSHKEYKITENFINKYILNMVEVNRNESK